MPTASIEWREAERLLNEQLERMRRASTASSRQPPFAWRPWRRRAATPMATRPAKARLAGWVGRMLRRRRQPDRQAERQDEIAILRRERALDEIYEAAALGPARKMPASGETSRSGRLPNVRKRGLPNLSDEAGRLAVMKQEPEHDWGPPPKVQFPRPEKSKDRRSDLIVAALGAALGLTCALFPWYIFFNQEQFGVQTIAFGGRGSNAGRIVVEPKDGNDAASVAAQQAPRNLDLFSTGTLPAKAETAEEAPGIDQQPFPAEAAEFRLVHVANGRAMIEDDAGLWIVQQGSLLPDSTRVKAIEKRDGGWVLVTSTDRVVKISD